MNPAQLLLPTNMITRLERAWNDGDGTPFGEPFAADADFVDIRGDHYIDRGAIPVTPHP